MKERENKLIADFMDMKYSEKRSFSDGEWIHSIKSLSRYESDFTWLMAVVDKIEGKRDSKGNAHRFSICMCDAAREGTERAVIGARSKEDAIYEACIQFITRHNMIEILNN